MSNFKDYLEQCIQFKPKFVLNYKKDCSSVDIIELCVMQKMGSKICVSVT